MCAGPIWSSPRSWALVLAATTTARALSVKRSNIVWVPLGSERAGAPAGRLAEVGSASVLLVHGLPGHAEDLGDLLPGPAVVPGVVHLERLKLLQEPAQGGDGAKPGARVRAVGRRRQFWCLVHDVNLC